mgnify:CR=1 FL=1
MTTMTISLPYQIAKKIDEETVKAGFATRSEFIRNIVRQHFSDREEIVFEEFVPKPLSQIRRNFEKTGKYNKKFIDSLIEGLKTSSFYDRKTTQNKSG